MPPATKYTLMTVEQALDLAANGVQIRIGFAHTPAGAMVNLPKNSSSSSADKANSQHGKKESICNEKIRENVIIIGNNLGAELKRLPKDGRGDKRQQRFGKHGLKLLREDICGGTAIVTFIDFLIRADPNATPEMVLCSVVQFIFNGIVYESPLCVRTCTAFRCVLETCFLDQPQQTRDRIKLDIKEVKDAKAKHRKRPKDELTQSLPPSAGGSAVAQPFKLKDDYRDSALALWSQGLRNEQDDKRDSSAYHSTKFARLSRQEGRNVTAEAAPVAALRDQSFDIDLLWNERYSTPNGLSPTLETSMASQVVENSGNPHETKRSKLSNRSAKGSEGDVKKQPCIRAIANALYLHDADARATFALGQPGLHAILSGTNLDMPIRVEKMKNPAVAPPLEMKKVLADATSNHEKLASDWKTCKRAMIEADEMPPEAKEEKHVTGGAGHARGELVDTKVPKASDVVFDVAPVESHFVVNSSPSSLFSPYPEPDDDSLLKDLEAILSDGNGVTTFTDAEAFETSPFSDENDAERPSSRNF